jgi:hypothetical protein
MNQLERNAPPLDTHPRMRWGSAENAGTHTARASAHNRVTPTTGRAGLAPLLPAAAAPYDSDTGEQDGKYGENDGDYEAECKSIVQWKVRRRRRQRGARRCEPRRGDTLFEERDVVEARSRSAYKRRLIL